MKRLRALSTLMFAALCLSLSGGSAIAAPSASGQTQRPGAPLGPDPFQIFFDEFGTGFYQGFDPSTGQYGPIVNNPGTVVGGFLQFLLPEAVGLGDVGIAGPQEGETCNAANFGSCSDGLRFIFADNNYYLQFFSELPFGETPVPLADTGLPADFDPAVFVDEVGTPDVFESFLYVAGATPHTPSNSNFYNGVSDGRIPEPTTLAFLSPRYLVLLLRDGGTADCSNHG